MALRLGRRAACWPSLRGGPNESGQTRFGVAHPAEATLRRGVYSRRVSAVEQYWAGVLQRLRAEVDVFARLIGHNAERGRSNELALARVLEAFLPTRWGVGTGLLIDSSGRQSSQMDIVIYERADEPAVFAQTTQILFPVETVVGVIEVKTTLTSTDVDSDFVEKKASIEALESTTPSRPLVMLLAYDCEPSPETLAAHLHQDSGTNSPELACVLNWCALAGTPEALGGDGYRVGNCLLQLHGDDGELTTAWEVVAEEQKKERAVIRDGKLLPVIRRSDGERYIGDPGRTLLLFVEALTRLGATRRGHPIPTLSAYLSDAARALYDIEPAS